jgi:hypothetical protein
MAGFGRITSSSDVLTDFEPKNSISTSRLIKMKYLRSAQIISSDFPIARAHAGHGRETVSVNCEKTPAERER